MFYILKDTIGFLSTANMINWFKKSPKKPAALKPVNGIEILRAVWGLDAQPAQQEIPSGSVNSDIYQTARHNIPRRPRPRSR